MGGGGLLVLGPSGFQKILGLVENFWDIQGNPWAFNLPGIEAGNSGKL